LGTWLSTGLALARAVWSQGDSPALQPTLPSSGGKHIDYAFVRGSAEVWHAVNGTRASTQIGGGVKKTCRPGLGLALAAGQGGSGVKDEST
jgi:hypothetical protein